MPKCTFCQHEVNIADKVGRRDVCPSCSRDLHCCFQCSFYDASAHHQCREPEADFVAEKDKANFCDYFVFDPQIKVKTADIHEQKAKFDALFKKR